MKQGIKIFTFNISRYLRLPDVPAERYHFQGSLSRFVTFVAMQATNSFLRLLQIIYCKNAENHRHGQQEVEPYDAVCNGPANIFEMWGISPHHTAQGNKSFGSC